MAEGTSTQKARRCVREANQEAKQKNHKETVKLYEDAAESYDLEEKYEAQRARPNQGIRTKFNVYWDIGKKWNAYITKGKGKKPPKAGESGSKNNYEKKLETELEKAIMVADVAGLEGAKKVPIKFPHVFTGKQKPWKGILLFGVRL
ncbi:Vacuolar protein sorting-associated protein 4A [Zootermopsis nevadensis]|uniref:Vacuolar protein sorting-associated protein 4A n=1 Tax=Zootermopsis nevadensis TaxID=136037 RepID=A0A067QKJ8_ZOONE|nr:Vacuolar protein sorting-associated protein 4A [Zootermopsis nevadensis]